MGIKADIDITADQRRIVLHLVRAHLPDVDVWAYGSRVNGNARPHSDLDIVAFTAPGQNERVADLRHAFEESDLPFAIDLFAWDDLPESFHRHIERGYVVLQHGAPDARRPGNGWRSVTLGDCAIINDASYSPKEAWPFIHYLDTGNVTDNRIAAIHRLVPGTDTIPSRARRKVQPGDIVYSTVRPDQRHFGLLKDPPDNLLVSTAFAVIRGKAGVAHTDFLYWFLAQRHVVERLHTIAEHSVSAYPSIRPDDIARLELRLPPLPEQRRIAHVLGTLDDKIALNRRLNATLEDMARALFKSWFVDFDPVHAKAALKRHARSHHSPLQAGDETATVHERRSSPSVSPSHHSPRSLSLSKGEGESARQGRSPQSSRWGVVRRGYSRHALTAARTLRRNRTDAEGLLWHYLRNKQLDGYRFRRQHPIGPYIVDFACLSRKVLIELDRGQHAEQTGRDEKRDAFLRARGYRVLRFWNTEVFENCFGVLERVYEAVAGDPPPQSPAPEGLATATPPQGGSDEKGTPMWTVERARAYLDGMDPEVAALFPDGFEDSEVGEIPNGWEIRALGKLAKMVRGRSYKSQELVESKTALVTLKSFARGGGYRSDGLKSFTGKYNPDQVILPGEIVVACTDVTQAAEVVGRPAIVQAATMYSVLVASLDVLIIRPRYEDMPKSFLYLLMGSENFRSHTYSHTTGTTVLHLEKEAIPSFRFAYPPIQITRLFGDLTRPTFEAIQRTQQESDFLSLFENTLLPRLISGELCLQDAEKQVEGIV